jgi:oxygen-independent coproporphyrinogen-3 oxidase
VHNLNYWSFGDYLAVGAGAHAKISDQAGVWRYAKAANPQQYMAAIEAGGTGAKLVPVTAQARLFEFMLNASRLKRAFSAVQFASRTGLAAEVLRERLRQPLERGLIEAAGSDSWRVTTLGERFLNDLQAEFLPE